MSKDMLLYIAIKNREERSNMEDSLVLDGIDVTAFPSAAKLWEAFQIKPAQFVITDRRFAHDFDGLKLARAIRKHFMLPYALESARFASTRSRRGPTVASAATAAWTAAMLLYRLATRSSRIS
jgi:DNA-binding NtrC family response regulator